MATSAPRGFLTVGVTGGIGSGKSTVCRLFAHLGRHVIHADTLARAIVETDGAVRSELKTAFGRTIFTPGGSLDRTALAARVFSNPSDLTRLNQIVHPVVFSLIESEIQALPAKSRFPYVLVEAALIFETGYDTRLDYTLVVDAEEPVRIERIATRDRLPIPDVKRRMASQMSPAEKRKRADFLVLNDGSEAELMSRVRLLNTVFTALAEGRS
jgi:dephospho-CoA kinase